MVLREAEAGVLNLNCPGFYRSLVGHHHGYLARVACVMTAYEWTSTLDQNSGMTKRLPCPTKANLTYLVDIRQLTQDLPVNDGSKSRYIANPRCCTAYTSVFDADLPASLFIPLTHN